MFKEDHEFLIHHAQQEVRAVAFQNHLQSPGIQLAKKMSFNALCRISKQGSQFGITLLCREDH